MSYEFTSGKMAAIARHVRGFSRCFSVKNVAAIAPRVSAVAALRLHNTYDQIQTRNFSLLTPIKPVSVSFLVPVLTLLKPMLDTCIFCCYVSATVLPVYLLSI